MKNEYNKRKDDSPEMADDDLMGSRNDGFHARVRQEKERNMQRAAAKQEEMQRKYDEFQAKEDAKLAPLRALAMRFSGGAAIAPQPPV